MHPERKSIGRVIIGTFLGGILSADVVGRLLSPKKGVLYNGQNKETQFTTEWYIRFPRWHRHKSSVARRAGKPCPRSWHLYGS